VSLGRQKQIRALKKCSGWVPHPFAGFCERVGGE
jgi:hypothetical protein